MKKTIDIAEWIDRCIEGPGGLLSYETKECAIRLKSDEIVAANWIIRCLANPECKGSEEVLQAIIERRKDTEKQNYKVNTNEKSKVSLDRFVDALEATSTLGYSLNDLLDE